MAKSTGSLFEAVCSAHPDLDECGVIRQVCERLLSDAEAEPPIPVERVASLRGIAAIQLAEQPFAGMLTPRDGRFVATIRASDSFERQRFTICHETAHTFFPGFTERQFRCASSKTQLEQRCDAAASELLLPQRFFQGDLRAGGFGLSTTEDLAEAYEASIEASALRAVDLWPEPALLLSFSERHKPSERGREPFCAPRLRLDYAHHQGGWPYFLQHKSASVDSVFGRALAGEFISEIGSLDEVCSVATDPVEIHARRYGTGGRVLAIVRRPTTRR